MKDALVSIWARVLGPDALQSGDDLLGAGGDAVTVDAMLALVRDAFDVAISVPAFLRNPTLPALSELIQQQLELGRPALEPGSAPVAFSQEGMLWHEQFSPGSFNLPPLVRRYQGRLDVVALSRSLADVIARHAPLRTTFQIVAGRPVQTVAPARPPNLSMVDLSSDEPEAQRAVIAAVVGDAASRPFDLSADPLFSPCLYRLGVQDHVLVIRVHHLVFDDWAVDVFRRELSTCYAAHAAGETPALPELRVDFAGFCHRQRRHLAGPAGAAELTFWRRELAGAPVSVRLPIGDPERPAGSKYPPAVPLGHRLPRNLVQPIRALARQQRCTLFMALLAVFAVVVRSFSGQEDLLMASVVANRNSADLEALIGCFTKKILLRLRLAEDATFAELVANARASVLGALAHQDLAFETVVQEVLGTGASPVGVVPDISVMFQADAPHTERLALPGLTVGGFDTATSTRQPHFASGDDAAESTPWGAGLYPGTFLILSVVEADDGVTLVARGAFHPPAVTRVLNRFEAVLAEAVAHPTATVAQLTAAIEPSGRTVPAGVDVGGFLVEPGRIEAALAGYPGVRQVTVKIDRAAAGPGRIVAHLVPDGSAPIPNLAELRAFLWSKLPGYAWPTAVVVEGTGAGDGTAGRAPLTSPEQILTTLWSEVLGGGPVRVEANYWQRFSFVDVLRRAERGGLEVSAEQVRRNRTLQALSADVSSGRAAPKR
ncbi:MAG: condensation domain-containing protein [Actinomycetota bacterium]|nr:condensation domain-containing protein [Actinomycetota bacterium]